jgi:hypothetical protein
MTGDLKENRPPRNYTAQIALAVAASSLAVATAALVLARSPDPSYVYQINSTTSEGVGLFLENNGSGPARILETKVYLDNQKVSNFGQITELTKSLYKRDRPTYFYMKLPYTLGVSKRVGIYYTALDNVQDQEWDNFKTLIWKRIFVMSKICSTGLWQYLGLGCYYICTYNEGEDCVVEERARIGS